jgi:hypothetical protein
MPTGFKFYVYSSRYERHCFLYFEIAPEQHQNLFYLHKGYVNKKNRLKKRAYKLQTKIYFTFLLVIFAMSNIETLKSLMKG